MSEKKKICFVAAVELTIRAFLLEQLSALSKHYDVTVIVNTNNPNFLRELGIPLTVIPVGIQRKISLLNDIRAWFKLWSIFRKEKFHSVHSVTPKAGFSAMTAGWLSGIPVRIHMFTGQVWATKTGFLRWILKMMDNIIARCATHVLADSFSQKDFLVSQGVVSKKKLEVLAKGSISGVDTNRFFPDEGVRKRIRTELGIPVDDVVFLFLGRLTKDKGVLDIAEAFSRVCKNATNAQLLVAGGDEENLQPRMEALCRSCAGKIHFLGFVPSVPPYMCAADVFCLPSYREGFGSVILEAAACGVPAIGSRIYGISDAIVDGETGLFHEAGNVDEMVSAMVQFIRDPELRKKVGKNAYSRVLGDFSRERVTHAVLHYYLEEILPLTPKPRLCFITIQPITYWTILKFRFKKLKEHFNILLVSGEGEWAQEVRDSEQVGLVETKMVRTISLLSDLYGLAQIIWILRKFKPDIVHTAVSKSGFVGMLASYIVGTPVRIHSVVGLRLIEEKGFRHFTLYQLEKITCALAHYVYPDSRSLYKYLVESKLCPERKLRMFGLGALNGVDTESFHPRLRTSSKVHELKETLCISKDAITIGYHGRIIAQKGVPELVSAFLDMLKEFPNLHLLLIGFMEHHDRPIPMRTEELIHSHPRIHYTGWVDSVEEYLACTDIFVHPTHREGFSNALLQSGAIGLPSVTCDVMGARDPVIPGETAILVPARDTAALYRAIVRLILNPQEREAMGKKAREHVINNFEQSIVYNNVLNEYFNLLGEVKKHD